MVLTLTTTNDSVFQSAGTVTATLTGVTSGPSTYSIGPPASATVTVNDGPLQNSVIITAVTDSVVEGNPVRFTVTAAPAPAKDSDAERKCQGDRPQADDGHPPDEHDDSGIEHQQGADVGYGQR